MRFHVVGVGAIGTLLSFHLKRTSRLLALDPNAVQDLPHPPSVPFLPSPFQLGVILRLRRPTIGAGKQKTINNTVIVEKDNGRERESGFGVELQGSLERLGGVFTGSSPQASTSYKQLPGSSHLETLGYPKGSIDSLLVTTKAQNTVSAIRPLLPHITSATTIVLLQNGQGVLDALLDQLFPDPNNRPHFVLASTSHGAWLKTRLHCVHAGFGKLDFGVVPSPILGRDYERILQPREAEEEGAERRTESSPAQELSAGGEGVTIQAGRDSVAAPQKQRAKRARSSAMTIRPAPLLDISAIPGTPATQTLTNTIAMLLNLPLSVTWQPIRNFQMLSLIKLVVNACINPVTALVECRNGDLFGNRHADSMIRDVCREVNVVLEALVTNAHRRQMERNKAQSKAEDGAAGNEDEDWGTLSKSDYLITPSNAIGGGESSGLPVLHHSLRPGALYEEVQRVIRTTGPNYSSMFQDIQHSASSTEIAYINGYFSRLGKSLGVPTPVNDQLVKLIQLKTSRTSGSWASKM